MESDEMILSDSNRLIKFSECKHEEEPWSSSVLRSVPQSSSRRQHSSQADLSPVRRGTRAHMNLTTEPRGTQQINYRLILQNLETEPRETLRNTKECNKARPSRTIEKFINPIEPWRSLRVVTIRTSRNRTEPWRNYECPEEPRLLLKRAIKTCRTQINVEPAEFLTDP